MTTENVVEVRGLRKTYKGGFEAVRGIDFDIHRGETFALLGPNGAGKSTTIEILEGYRDRTGGEVRVLGTDPRRGDLAWKAKLGIVLQSTGETGTATVREALTHFAGYYPNPRDVDEVIAAVGLEEKARTRISRLSGGQKRRVDVALGIIGRPELLFLDEPTTGLDPQARHVVWDRLFRLRQQGVTLVLTSHYMDEVEQLCSRLVVMDKGVIVAEGSPLGLIAEHSTREVAELRFAVGENESAASKVEDLADRVEVLPDRLLLYTADGEETVAKVHERGLEPVATLVRRSTLEDVFLRLTGRTLVD